MNHKQWDRQTGQASDPGLESIRSAWRELEHTEPPQLLDQAVLNTARLQVERTPKFRRLRWLGAFATAAVVVIAVTLVVRQDQYAPAPTPSGDGFRLEKSAAAPPEAGDQPMLLEQSAAAPAAMQRADSDTASASDEPRRSRALPGRELGEAQDEETPQLSPEAWIEQMLALHQAGRMEELSVQLEAFRRAFPDYPLPAELGN
jgi:hypothetical protein